jgi:hypothetical protein
VYFRLADTRREQARRRAVAVVVDVHQLDPQDGSGSAPAGPTALRRRVSLSPHRLELGALGAGVCQQALDVATQAGVLCLNESGRRYSDTVLINTDRIHRPPQERRSQFACNGLASRLRPDCDTARTEIAAGIGSNRATAAVANTVVWNMYLLDDDGVCWRAGEPHQRR